MAQTFFITKGSTLPNLRMEVINDGRYDFKKLYLALQSADVTFTMTDLNTGVKKIANAKADIVEKNLDTCDTQYVIEYKWKQRDTSTAGTYIGQFNISFSDNLSVEGMSFPSGNMIVPIAEDLVIVISDNGLKK